MRNQYKKPFESWEIGAFGSNTPPNFARTRKPKSENMCSRATTLFPISPASEARERRPKHGPASNVIFAARGARVSFFFSISLLYH